MTLAGKPKNILTGVDGLIDEALRVTSIGTRSPHYRRKKACQKLTCKPEGFEARALAQELYDCIEDNWRSGRRNGSAPKENWRLRRRSDMSGDNRSRETRLERAIIQLDPDTWSNQIPTSSGLLGSRKDKRRAIDLVRDCAPSTGKRHYELIELKVESDTPLYAAFEVLLYGLLYLFSRKNRIELGYAALDQQRLLKADGIHLRVLAPRKFYEGSRLGWLEQSLSRGIGVFAREFGVEMDFVFLILSTTFARAYES